jgi:hypothetical protein
MNFLCMPLSSGVGIIGVGIGVIIAAGDEDER